MLLNDTAHRHYAGDMGSIISQNAKLERATVIKRDREKRETEIETVRETEKLLT